MIKFSQTLLAVSFLISGLAHAAPQRSPFTDIMNQLQSLTSEVSSLKAQSDSNASSILQNSQGIMLNSQSISSLNARVESLELENAYLRSQLKTGSDRMTALEAAVRALQASNPTDPTDPVDPVVCNIDVYLADYGPRKLDVIKAVNTIFGVGLARAKEIVESAPVMLASNVTRGEAEAMRGFLFDAGAEVSLRANNASCQ